MKLGRFSFDKTAALAPMAGVADTAFRTLCRQFGAAFAVSEMVSAKGVTYDAKKSKELMEITSAERPMGVQLFGSDPLTVAKAAETALAYSPDWLDINMGCPAPKIAGSGGGSALMKDPPLAAAIAKEVVHAVDLPVTVKFRKGWDDEHVNAVEFAKRLEQAGVAAMAVHGRTRAQMYAPKVDLDIIRQVKQAVSVPVIGNGDVCSAKDAAEMYRQTGCDLVMVGRGALGSPWLFSQIRAFLLEGKILPEPPITERLAVMRRHIRLLCDCKGERTGMREARKHVAWYMKGLHGAAAFRKRAGALTEFSQLDPLIEDILAQNGDPSAAD